MNWDDIIILCCTTISFEQFLKTVNNEFDVKIRKMYYSETAKTFYLVCNQ